MRSILQNASHQGRAVAYGVLRFLLLTTIQFAITRDATALPFDPTACSICPTYTEVSWPFEASDPDSGVEWFPGYATYTNNTFEKRWVGASLYVADIKFHITSWKTGGWSYDYDFMRFQQGVHASYIMAGIWPDNLMPRWIDVATVETLSQEPVRLDWVTDEEGKWPGFEIDKIAICCQSGPGAIIPSNPMVAGARYMGVLQDDHDVVYYWIGGPAYGEQINVALWGSGEDFDLYARCGNLPTPLTYVARGYRTGSLEFITVSHDICPSGSVYLAVNSFSGAGRYDLVASRTLSSNDVSRIDVAIETGNPAHVDIISNTLREAVRLFYGATEGQILFRDIHIWRVPTGWINYSDVDCRGACIRAGAPEQCFMCFTDETWSPTGFVNELGGPAFIRQPAWDEPTTVVHEWGHSILRLGDEYTTWNGYDWSQCGHTIMGVGYWPASNLCVDSNHNLDGWGEGAPPSGLPANWDYAFAIGDTVSWTPDTFNYLSHDLGGVIHIILH